MSRQERYKRNIDEKKYYCEKCDKSFRDNTMLNTHLNSKKHNGFVYVYRHENK